MVHCCSASALINQPPAIQFRQMSAVRILFPDFLTLRGLLRKTLLQNLTTGDKTVFVAADAIS
jgi:hypothetical protein